jgi:hypothetical protein
MGQLVEVDRKEHQLLVASMLVVPLAAHLALLLLCLRMGLQHGLENLMRLGD